MVPIQERGIIEKALVDEIQRVLIAYGIGEDTNFNHVVDDLRMEFEARAVLLNRVPDRNNQKNDYYGLYLQKIAEQHGVKYLP